MGWRYYLSLGITFLFVAILFLDESWFICSYTLLFVALMEYENKKGIYLRLRDFIHEYFHKHKWSTTLHNKYMISVEEHCRCGEYRHHLFADQRGIDEEPFWRKGKHPNSPYTEKSND